MRPRKNNYRSTNPPGAFRRISRAEARRLADALADALVAFLSRPDIRRYCRACRVDADEALGFLWLRLVDRLPPHIRDFGAWVGTHARHLLRDYVHAELRMRPKTPQVR